MTPDSKTNASDSSKEVNKSDFIKKWLAFFTTDLGKSTILRHAFLDSHLL
jgi:hypothetical protein